MVSLDSDCNVCCCPCSAPHHWQEHGELPRDFTHLFADSLFKLDLSFVPQVAALRRQLLGHDAAGRTSSVHSGFGGALHGSLAGSYPGGLTGLTSGSGGSGRSVPGLRRGGSQLPLWRPQLEVPFPPLQPAVFPPALPELPPPALELFDLEQELAGPLVSLSCVPCLVKRSVGAAAGAGWDVSMWQSCSSGWPTDGHS